MGVWPIRIWMVEFVGFDWVTDRFMLMAVVLFVSIGFGLWFLAGFDGEMVLARF
jgi:hypothetical protein